MKTVLENLEQSLTEISTKNGKKMLTNPTFLTTNSIIYLPGNKIKMHLPLSYILQGFTPFHDFFYVIMGLNIYYSLISFKINESRFHACLVKEFGLVLNFPNTATNLGNRKSLTFLFQVDKMFTIEVEGHEPAFLKYIQISR